MFTDLIRRLTASHPERLPEADARVALAALMVRVARSDGHYAPAEVARIDKCLMQRHNLSEAEAQALRVEAEGLEAEAPDTVRFTRAIKDAVALEDRVAVIETLWSVALADGTRDSEEDTLLRLLVNLLGVSDVESAQARQRAEARG
ncbi:Tellurite resistance protein [Jannaschia seosinensis]|uniref:Tellurite resistance protein n=1 Tax=Jannaschia seosinensis TaxID=313367 RepID=A0A0M7B911_9RHOB|nr:TerB family tellurite resistance protein [Jannaschia seosinensis]CUH18529.1 Tellurite resistance protein [Jannaschia seosinensis]